MYVVKEEADGFHVYWDEWGIGYVFENQEFAEAAAQALNDNVALDRLKAQGRSR